MEPLPAPEPFPNKARRVLAAAAVIQVALFVYHARGSFRDLLDPPPVTPADRTGPFAKGADCIGYYAWLRSPLIDGDFHFDDEFAPTFARAPAARAAYAPTATGHVPNPWPVGPALVWASAVVTTHLALSALGSHSPWPADGYSAPYQLAVGATTLALALLTLGLLYRINRRFVGPTPAAAAAALVMLGTPVVAYSVIEVSVSHGPATAALALFVLVWLRTFGNLRPGRWVGLGGLLGLTCLMRWQLATFAVLPALEAAWLAWRANGPAARLGIAARLALAGLATAVAFTPQLAARQIIWGNPAGGLHRTGQNWLSPSLWAVLGSTNHGLFYWTPLTLPAFAGLVLLAVRCRRPAVAMLAAAVVVQIYTIAAMLGGDVYLGWPFGFRFLTETGALLAPGLAVLLARTGRGGAVAGGLLVGWNLFLLGVYRFCVGGDQGGDPVELLAMVSQYVFLRPLDAVGMVVAAGWLTSTLATAFGPGRAAAANSDQAPPRLAA